MSADNMIYIQKNSKGRWVAQHWFASNEGRPDPGTAPYGSTYPTLEMAVEMNHDRARETEYGFSIHEEDYEAVRQEREARQDFQAELQQLLNSYSMENQSGTPDFLLAEYLTQQLVVWNNTMAARSVWRGESLELPALSELKKNLFNNYGMGEGKPLVP